VIGPRLLAAIHDHAREQPHQEVCGVLLGAWGSPMVIQQVMRGVNLASAPDRFLLDAATLLAADRAATEHALHVVGFYHSHPSHYPIPSPLDRHDAWPDHIYLITRTSPAATCAWRVDSARHVHALLIVQDTAH
jgi:desampylase